MTGHVAAAAGDELSGLVLSPARRGVLWGVNDSGDRARVLALTPSGRLLADVAVTGAQNVDWEDIAAARGALYIGDIGDNLAARANVTVYRVPEPRPGAGATAPAGRAVLRYPDGAQDAEALLVDPSTGDLVIVTKAYGGTAGVYAAESSAVGATTTLRRTGTVSLGPAEAVTAGDVSRDGRTVILRSYGQAFVFSRRRGEPVAAALRRRPCVAGAGLLGEGQGESIALEPGGQAFYTGPEGSRAPIRRYSPGR